MARSRRLVATLAVVLLIVAAAPPALAASGDPWYLDVGGHWGYPYIRSLWESGLTDGWLNLQWPWYPRAYYEPQQQISRSQYVMLLAKTFGLAPESDGPPAFTDVPTSYSTYGGKPAFGYVQAAARARIARGDGTGRFWPDNPISRQEAIAMLVRALDLGPMAEAMPPEDVTRELRRFWDGLSVDQSLRREVAVAVKLRILLGYPDGSLQPRNSLGRAEAAAVLYRSALIRATAQPNPFSPDGDGDAEATTFLLTSLKNGNASAWRLVISLYDEQTVIKTFSGTGPVPPSLSWDGSDWAGRALGSGTYYYRPYLTDRNGQVITGVLKPVTLEAKRLSAVLRPSTAEGGQRVTVDAQTEGGALQVIAHLGSGSSPGMALQPQSPPPRNLNEWVGTFTVPANQVGGIIRVYVQARFGTGERWVTVPLMVLSPLWLEAVAVPDQLRAGDSTTFTARTSPGFIEVSAFWPTGQEIPLAPEPRGHWQAAWQIPAGTPPGPYDVVVRGWARGRVIQTTVRVTVDVQLDVQVFLSD